MKSVARSAWETLPKILAPSRAKPAFLICFVTNDCNYRCEHCFIDDLSEGLEKQMTLDEWSKTAGSVGSPEILLFTGGEPSLRQDFSDIAIQFLSRARPRHLLIASNGSHPQKLRSQVEKILSVQSDSKITVGISLDGPEAIHDRVRRKKGAFQAALQTIASVQELQKIHPRLSLNINTTFCRINQDEVMKFVGWLRKEVKPEGISLSLIRDHEGEIAAVDHDLYRQAMEQVHERSFFSSRVLFTWMGQVISRAKTQAILRSSEKNEQYVPCLAGKLVGVIKHHGDVHPCETLEDKLGNLRDVGYDFGRLWFSQEKRAFCEKIEETRCHCTHECFVSTNLALSPKSWLKVASGVLGGSL